MARPDPHSVFDDAQPRVRRLDWRARFDFATRVIDAEARLTIEGAGAWLDLDTRDLTIDRVSDDSGARLDVELGAPHPFMGQRLRIARPPRVVAIRYRTSPAAMALHWFNQSAEWLNQWVYSQCQPIYARSIVPLPDSPSARIAYRAELIAPRALTALMAAVPIDRVEAGDEATSTFETAEPIAPYLIAFAIGDYVARDLSPRSRVWTAPSLVDAAARALGDVERMASAAERLYGPYRWGRFDLLIAPSSFPYGGMENPRLAFLSPTLLGDREALVSVVAHELAHAWSGNLVGAASAEHCWLNEAFTVWGERRIVAAILGAEVASRQAAAGRRALVEALAAFAAQPERTRLRLALDGVDPDEGLSIVPYEKGYLMLRALEEALGEAAFGAFVRAYFARFAGQPITTEQFAEFAATRARGFAFAHWFDQSGLPSSVASDGSAREVRDADELPADWSNQLRDGRIKQLRPIYLALCRSPERRVEAARLYRQHRAGYHPIARQQLERLFREQGVAIEEVKPLGLGRRPT
ncbi:MAG TPA: M1 family aminopeptidase [Polyangia bacterium]|jgi:aminopeptidase N|nr:M1 family aminopeptidase [Polyangia bacterium]